jgi:hypothetical protein
VFFCGYSEEISRLQEKRPLKAFLYQHLKGAKDEKENYRGSAGTIDAFNDGLREQYTINSAAGRSQ